MDAKGLPHALKRRYIFDDLAARLKSGPSRNLRETDPFSAGYSRAGSG